MNNKGAVLFETADLSLTHTAAAEEAAEEPQEDARRGSADDAWITTMWQSLFRSI